MTYTYIPKTFVSSDIHFNHEKILEYCPNRGNSVDEMNQIIIDNWNSVVSPEDHCFILGDVAMGKISLAPELIRQLYGTKTLILGNHDKTLKKLIKNDDSLRDLFVGIHSYFEYTHRIGNKKVMLVMSHFPISHWNGMHYEDDGSHIASMMLHGHLHGNHSGLKGRIKDIGMDTNSLFPYLLNDVVEELQKITPNKHHHGSQV